MAHLNLPDSGVFRVSGSSLRLQLLYTLTCVFCFFNRTFYANVPCLGPPGPTARPHRGPERDSTKIPDSDSPGQGVSYRDCHRA